MSSILFRPLAVLLLWLASLPALAATISASPKAATPGGDFVASMTGLSAGQSYQMQLYRGGIGTVTYSLGQFTATWTEAARKAKVPAAAAAGSYELRLVAVSTQTLLDSFPFTVRSPLAITLEPTSAEPGKAVRITVAGLKAGSVAIGYAGSTIVGPVAVSDGTWVGKFIVPRDRPATIPSTTTVTATNYVGRLVASTGSRSFPVLAPSGLPRFRATTTVAPPPLVKEGSRLAFSGKLVTPDNKGTTGRTSFFWRPTGGGRVVPIDGGVITNADGSYTLKNARAPSFWMDGVPRSGSGEVVGVVSDDDPDVGTGRDSFVATGLQFASEPDEPEVSQIPFQIHLRGLRNGVMQDIAGAYVTVYGDLDAGFIDPASAPPPSGGDLLGIQSQFSIGTASVFGQSAIGPYAHGCEVTFARQFTGTDGKVNFAIDPEAVQRAQMLGVMKSLGEIRTVDVGAPVPGVDVFQRGEQILTKQGGRKGAGFDASLSVTMMIEAGQQGFGSFGTGSQGTLLGVTLYEPSYVTLLFDAATGAVQVDSAMGGSATVSGQIVTVTLPTLPDGTSGVAPFDLRIAGVRGTQPSLGTAMYEFKGMHSFPSGTTWPPIAVRNNGRQMRFAWEAGFGQVSSAEVNIFLPNGSLATSAATLEGPSACRLSGASDYVGTLPDMTNWPFNPPNQAPYCRTGFIRVTLVGKPAAIRAFKLCTERPPAQITSAQVKNVQINALTSTYNGDLDMPFNEADESSSEMQEWDIPPLQNRSKNDGGFTLGKQPNGYNQSTLDATSGHRLGNEDTDDTGHDAGAFGFDDDGQPVRETVLDTGVIPLFRYPWGFSPIAGAVFGADFWLSSTLAFYGKMGYVDGSNLMDATIDPTLNGGLDIFFDLDVLFGLVSASVSAQPQLGLSMKQVIGRGGRTGDESGLCFGFDVDVAMEICAVFCAEDEFNLFSVREPDNCSVSMQKGLPLGSADQRAPRLLPSALAIDGEAHTVVLEAEASGRLVAYHMEGTELVSTRTISSSAFGAQHAEVEYLGSNRALAVWSQSSLTSAQLSALMTAPGAVRNNADDLARAQVLRWSWFDGSSWSAPQTVTGAQGGSGKPRLSVGRCLRFDCLRSSTLSAYLVWEYDTNQNIAAPDIEVWGAYFEYPGGFRGADRISGGGSTSDMHPDVAWLGSTPLVTWISSPLPHYQGSASRRISYRVVDDPDGGRSINPVRLASVPVRAGWPSLARIDSNSAVLAFTVAQDNSVVGNRNALHAAQVDCSGDACTFQSTEVRDTNGRQYRVERPVAAVDGDGGVMVSFRGLAFGPDGSGRAGRPSDFVGMLTGTGEHIAVRIPSFAAPITQVAPQGLSNDGLQHFRPDFVFDPAMDGFVGLSQRGTAAITKHAAFAAAKRFAVDSPGAVSGAKALGDAGLVLTTLAPTPDFRIESVTMSEAYMTAGQSRSFSVRIRNAGTDYDPAVHGSAMLLAAWDAPPGAGVEAMTPVALAALPSSGAVVRTRSVTMPAGHQADERRTLFIEVRSSDTTEDAMAGDNLAQHVLGAMPVPQALVASVKANSPMAALDWADSTDPRVVGYRVYKKAENGDFVPYGSTDVSGYADLFAGFRNVEQYRVTSYSARGIESEMSQIALAAPFEESVLFRNGFEVAVP
jgi:hypothetical protein